MKCQEALTLADTTFIVHSDWLDSLKDLPVEEQDKIIADTVRYGLDRDIIHGNDPRVQAFVKMKSKDIDFSKEKYEQKKYMAQGAGRRKMIDDRAIWELAQQGNTSAKIAEILGVSKSSVDHSIGWKKRREFLF